MHGLETVSICAYDSTLNRMLIMLHQLELELCVQAASMLYSSSNYPYIIALDRHCFRFQTGSDITSSSKEQVFVQDLESVEIQLWTSPDLS